MKIGAGVVGDAAALVEAFKAAAAARFTDLQLDLATLADVAAVLADIGVPDAQLAEVVFALLSRAAALKAQFAPGSVDEQYWFYHAGPRVER
jgi:hypothetical protein